MKRKKKENMAELAIKTMKHFFPNLQQEINKLPDKRQKNKVKYNKATLVYTAILGFMGHIGSLRQIEYKMDTDEYINTLNQLADSQINEMFDAEVLTDYIKSVNPESIEKLKNSLVKRLIKNKVFDFGRENKKFLIAIDGTGIYHFNERHCEHCLTKKIDNKIHYFHSVLEAKLIVDDIVVSIATEYIENEKENVTKQDCEINACKRLMKKLKEEFPRLAMCVLLDSLYAAKPIIELCNKNKWDYIINFKEGSIPSLAEEYENVLITLDENCVIEKTDKINGYRWVNELDYNEYKVNVFEDIEKIDNKITKFKWLTNIKISKGNVNKYSKIARKRWKIENEGFKEQKTNGYGIEHVYSKDYTAMKNYYQLIQIAHLINQLIEYNKIIKESLKKIYGGTANLAKLFLTDITSKNISAERYANIVNTKIQIRLSG